MIKSNFYPKNLANFGINRGVDILKQGKKPEGTTIRKAVNNVPELIKQAVGKYSVVETNNAIVSDIINNSVNENNNAKMIAKIAPQEPSTYDFGENISYKQGIEETLKNAGIEYDSALVERIYVEIMKANIDPNAPVKLNTHATISDVTRLIDISIGASTSDSIVDIGLVTKLIDKLLNVTKEKQVYSTDEDVRQFILNVANEILGADTPEEPFVNPPSVNLDGFFKSGETLTAYQIYNDKYGYLYGDDEVAQEIMTAINDVAKKLGIQVQPHEYQNLVNGIITKINEMCGVENTNPPVLAKSTLNKYFETNSMDDFKALINSPEIENAYWIEALKNAGFDEIINDFSQDSSQGDCYLCATLKSLSLNDHGKALIDKALGTEIIDGKVYLTVTFEGGFISKNNSESSNNWIKKTTTYRFTPEEILDAQKNARGNWANGPDNFEMILFEKALVEILKDQVYTTPPTNGYGNRYLYGGTPMMVMHLLTGDCGANTRYDSSASDFKSHVLALLNNGSIQEGTTGNHMMHIGFDGHACLISGIYKNYIEYINPYNTAQKIKLTWDEILANPSKYKNFQWAYIPEQN